ncbi:transglycosylase domain-containing protein [Lentzea sp. NBRC 105346]|uniref:transglycosylase domain-containing protein n=1 Tax=Lentzea sp. NBRC 105346 TaxID=3032205 RepID=UPI0025523729|nr:transglycosylase domain-containing protein [Lentzea sp. NBRC 105346]
MPPRRPGEEATTQMPHVAPPVQREPGLLTHREPDEDPDLYDDDYYDDDEPELTEEEERRLRKKKIWKRVRIGAFVALGLMILGPVLAVAIAYPLVNWPHPEEVAAGQNKTITLHWADGSEMAKITQPGQNLSMLKLDEVPDHVRKAVLAAEDANFYENPGFDAKAIVRAVWIQATGGSSGGSGLTQQYIKKATNNEAPTLTRKFTELVKAYKMSNESDHDTILEAYLNTVHFGRGANGMKAAAQVYYGKDMKDLTPSEAALIAGMIQTPSWSEDMEYAQKRWNFVMDQMQQKGWIDQAYRGSQQFPTPQPFEKTRPGGLEGPMARVQQQIENEVDSDDVGLTMEKAQKVGVDIYTTVDKNMQQAATDAVNAVMNGQDPDLRTSLSAIDPTTGAVKAYYAGKDGLQGIDYAKGTIQEAGSTFKPFDLIAALKMGKGIGDTYDGTSPRTIANQVIRNAGTSNCGKQCPIKQAMIESLNTVFYDMVANDTGTPAVADAAHEAGIPKTVMYEGKPFNTLVGKDGGKPNTGIAIGADDAQVRPFDMASAFATFAARGVYRKPFFITKIEGPDKELLYQHTEKGVPAFDPDPTKSQDLADNVTEVLKEIPKKNIACAGGRECAGKTGTHELPESKDQNSKAWMVGYTPSLSASVWVGKDQGNLPITDRKTGGPIFGSGIPGQIWKKFMDAALNGTPVEKFPKAHLLNRSEPPKITPSNTPSQTPSNTPTRTTDPNASEPTKPTQTKPTRPCGGVLCPSQPPTTTTDPPDPVNGQQPNP